MNLLEELGINPEDFRWELLALCQGISYPNVFFEEYDDEQTAKQVDEMCLSCPVMKQCYAAGKKGESGVWGAVYWNGAGKRDPLKNQHKTPEIDARIEERLAE